MDKGEKGMPQADVKQPLRVLSKQLNEAKSGKLSNGIIQHSLLSSSSTYCTYLQKDGQVEMVVK